jgi:hypothetical protein
VNTTVNLSRSSGNECVVSSRSESDREKEMLVKFQLMQVSTKNFPKMYILITKHFGGKKTQ